MRIDVLIRRGEGPFWGRLKRLARAVLGLHLPVGPLTRPVFRTLYGLRTTTLSCLSWLRRFLWHEPLFRSQCAAVGSGLLIDRLPAIGGRGTIILGDNVRLAGVISFGFLNRWIEAPELVIGDQTFIGHGCAISVGSSVRIGKHCLLAGCVSVSDYDGHPTDAALRRTSPAPRESIKPVVIGDDVWIGAGSRILKGVSIGDRSIVAAGAIVTKPVPPDVIVAGNPARIVKHLAAPEAERAEPCLAESNGREG